MQCHLDKAVSFLVLSLSLLSAGRFGFSYSLFLVCGTGVWRIKSDFLRVHHIPTIPTREALWALFIHSSRHGSAVVISRHLGTIPLAYTLHHTCGSLFGALFFDQTASWTVGEFRGWNYLFFPLQRRDVFYFEHVHTTASQKRSCCGYWSLIFQEGDIHSRRKGSA